MMINYIKYREIAMKRNDWLWRYHDKIKAINSLLQIKDFNFTKVFGNYPYKPNWWEYNWNIRIAKKHYAKLINNKKITPKHLAKSVIDTYKYLCKCKPKNMGSIDKFL